MKDNKFVSFFKNQEDSEALRKMNRLVFCVENGVLRMDEILDGSVARLRQAGWLIDLSGHGGFQISGNAPRKDGRFPGNGKPDFGVSLRTEYDDFGSYNEIIIRLPNGSRCMDFVPDTKVVTYAIDLDEGMAVCFTFDWRKIVNAEFGGLSPFLS